MVCLMSTPTGQKLRIMRAAPKIHLEPFSIQLPDGEQLVCSLAQPFGWPPDVRATQVFQLQYSDKRVAHLKYQEAVDFLRGEGQAPNEEVDPTLFTAVQAFVAAVDRDIRYDVQNLVHDYGVAAVAAVCGFSDPATLVARLTHKTEWGADALFALKVHYPQLDLEATLVRHCYWRSMRKRGLWATTPAPAIVQQYAKDQRLPELGEDLEGEEQDA